MSATASSPSSSSPAIRKRVGSKHDKTGCLTCRKRRKKCRENTLPVCGACARLHLRCIREPARDVFPSDAQTLQNTNQLPSAAKYSPLYQYPSELVHGRSESTQRRHVMRHYNEVLANQLHAGYRATNPFIIAVLPMAMESPILYNAVIALSSGHISITNPSYKTTAIESQSIAIRGLASALSMPLHEMSYHDISAAVCLVFLIHEVRAGGCKYCYSHLQAAKLFITYLLERSNSHRSVGHLTHSLEGKWILGVFSYYDIMASVTSRKSPLLYDYYIPGPRNILYDGLESAGEALYFVAEICHLDEETNLNGNEEDGEVVRKESTFFSQSIYLERLLLNWRCHSDTNPQHTAVYNADRSGALIVLYRLIRRRLNAKQHRLASKEHAKEHAKDQLQMKIQVQLRHVLRHMSRIPVGHALESQFLFSLFMAGGEATEDSQIQAVRARLQGLIQSTSYQNITLALRVLEQLWEERQDQGKSNADWEQILDASEQELLLV